MGREEIFIDLGGGAPKNADFLRKNDSNSEFYCLRRLRRPCWMACRPLTLSEAQGSWEGGPVGEYGVGPPDACLTCLMTGGLGKAMI